MDTYRIVSARRDTAPAAPGTCMVSFIVPAFDAQSTVPLTIRSIRAAAPTSCEVIVVDDGSIDETRAVADRLADHVVERPCQGGAARARNDGALVASGEVLCFVDADVTVTPAAVQGLLRHIDDGADAAFGAYEPLPPDGYRGRASDYKNLLHHYTHQTASNDAATFWSGFGAIRREAFFAVEGFDPAVTTSADVEDIHLGYRLRAKGYRIVLDPDLRVKHHKRYTVRGVVVSDIVHRAIPWTRAMLELRTFHSDLNLRQGAIAGAAVSYALLAALVAVPWAGSAAGLAAAGLAGIWFAQNAGFLKYARRFVGVYGMLHCAGLLYLYFLYGPAGAALGTAAFMLRHDRQSMLNWLHLAVSHVAPDEVAVTVAVVKTHAEPMLAIAGLPPPEPWWELVLVASERPEGVPSHVRFLQAPPHLPRHLLRDMALEAACGHTFASLDASCVPESGWLERVRTAGRRGDLVVGGSFREDRRSLRARASHVARYWQWRPERRGAWLVDHPATNVAFPSEIGRKLGGFKVEGALMLRLAGFGARPVRFEPGMRVRLAAVPTLWSTFHGCAGVARLRASAAARYLAIGRLHRLVLVLTSPVAGLASLVRIVRQARREGTADATFWLALPFTTLALVGFWLGRAAGLARPGVRGGYIPRSEDDFAALALQFPAVPASATAEPTARLRAANQARSKR